MIKLKFTEAKAEGEGQTRGNNLLFEIGYHPTILANPVLTLTPAWHTQFG